MIDGDRDYLGSSDHKSLARSQIAGLFHPCAIFRVEQNVRGKLQTLLRARGYQDLRRVAAYCTNRAQIFRDCFTKWRVSHRVAVSQHFSGRFARMPDHKFRPYGGWKVIERWKAHTKSDQVVQPQLLLQAQQFNAPRDSAWRLAPGLMRRDVP